MATTAQASPSSSSVRPHRERRVDGRRPDLELEQSRSLRGRRMRVLGTHNDVPVRGGGAGGGECGDQARGGRVLEMAVERIGKSEQLPQPVERHLLQLLQGRRGAPEDPHLVERRDQELGQNPRFGRRRGEVGEVARALPMRDPRHQDLVQIAQQCREGLGLVRWRGGKRGPDRPRLDARQDGILPHVLEVARDPVEGGGAVVAEGAHCRLPAISAQGRVFSTCSFVSQARRACPIPSSA